MDGCEDIFKGVCGCGLCLRLVSANTAAKASTKEEDNGNDDNSGEKGESKRFLYIASVWL